MSLGKKDIIKNISTKAHISFNDSSIVFERFIDFIKYNKDKLIKIHGFGTFTTVYTPKRVGRNPKTKEKFNIQARKKLKLNTSNQVRSKLN